MSIEHTLFAIEGFIHYTLYLDHILQGTAKSIVHIIQVVPQQSSENFPQFTL
jgi:hypothetical protein